MDKQQQFLWMVQTITLANATNLASEQDSRDSYRHEISATGAYMTADEALRASELIPASMSASEAAHDFCFFMLSNLREADSDDGGKRRECPAWFARR